MPSSTLVLTDILMLSRALSGVVPARNAGIHIFFFWIPVSSTGMTKGGAGMTGEDFEIVGDFSTESRNCLYEPLSNTTLADGMQSLLQVASVIAVDEELSTALYHFENKSNGSFSATPVNSLH
ncbi:UNVERIFIED_CONTAM: hypothetical protein NCL1_27972 [Trichonephila clavipes]